MTTIEFASELVAAANGGGSATTSGVLGKIFGR